MGKGKREEKFCRKEVLEEAKNLLVHSIPHNNGEEAGPPPPPDGGWGWIIVAASFLCNMVLDGIGYSFGILLNPLMKHYGEGRGTIAMVGSILTGAIMLIGPVASMLVNRYGARTTCIAGSLVSAISIFLSTFSPNVYLLMISYGLLGGLGLGLMYVPAVTAVGYWFEKKRSLVTGISTCGSGFGTIVFAPVVTALEAGLGWQCCNRILAGLCLACTFLGGTMRSVPTKKKDEEDLFTVLKQQKENPIIKKKLTFLSESNVPEPEFIEAQVPAKENGYLTVLKNVPFLLVMLGNFPAIMGLYIPYIFLPGITQQRGLTESESALLISLIGFFNTGGRIVSGAVTDHPRVDALLVSTVALFFGGICPFLMTFCYNFWSFTIVCILFGLSLSAWIAVTSPLLVDLLGLELLTSAFGILTFLRGVAALLGPPLAGFVIDATSKQSVTPVLDPVLTNATVFAMETGTTLSEISPDASTQEDLSNYQIAFCISAFLLCLASAGHLVAFCVRKADTKEQAVRTIDDK